MNKINFQNFINKLVGDRVSDFNNFYLAFTHPSYDNKNNYERLEFLGDSVLNLVITHILYQRYLDLKEGVLSKKRISYINGRILAKVSKSLNFHEWINLGKGEEKDLGAQKESILADVFEAFIGAMYIDKGIDFVIKWVENRFYLFESSKEVFTDFKSLLQEYIQTKKGQLPEYKIEKEEGKDHNKIFHVRLILSDNEIFYGVGKTRKNAEQEAAKKAYLFLKGEFSENE